MDGVGQLLVHYGPLDMIGTAVHTSLSPCPNAATTGTNVLELSSW